MEESVPLHDFAVTHQCWAAANRHLHPGQIRYGFGDDLKFLARLIAGISDISLGPIDSTTVCRSTGVSPWLETARTLAS